jgi:hypothetical protein
VYELYPVSEATEPLLAGTQFDVVRSGSTSYSLKTYNASGGLKLLNPRIVRNISVDGKSADAENLAVRIPRAASILSDVRMSPEPEQSSGFVIRFDCVDSIKDGTMAFLLAPDTGLTLKSKPVVTVLLDGKEIQVKTEEQEGKSRWYTAGIVPGRHVATVRVLPGREDKSWSGTVAAWLVARQQQPTGTVDFTLQKPPEPRLMPPHPWLPGEVRKSVKIGQLRIAGGKSPVAK